MDVPCLQARHGPGQVEDQQSKGDKDDGCQQIGPGANGALLRLHIHSLNSGKSPTGMRTADRPHPGGSGL
jgi:hypothetical protein